MDNNKLQQSLLNAKRFMQHDKLNVSSNKTFTTTDERPVTNSGKNSPLVKDFKTPQATYNIPDNITESAPPPTAPIPKPMNMNPHSGLNEERIKSSNLPPEIKKLMIENPIQDPSGAGGAMLNDNFINKVSEKMKSDEFSINKMRSTSNNNIGSMPKNIKKNTTQKTKSSPIPAINENFSSSLDYSSLKKVIKECVKEVISENDLLIEKTNIKENLQLRVGNKIFIGSIKSVKTIKKK